MYQSMYKAAGKLLAAVCCCMTVYAANIPLVTATTRPSNSGPGHALSVAPIAAGRVVVPDPASFCQSAALQALADKLSNKVTIKALPPSEIGPNLPGGAGFTAASGSLPAYCQVTGSYVTNPKTGKTSNFLATFPVSWNRKYLQVGCSGHCGSFAVSNVAMPTITVTNQGKPGDAIMKGYASFATDEGHAGFSQGQWARKSNGELDEDALEDFLYRSQKVLSQMGKQLTLAFYTQASGQPQTIAYSYFCGCSGGGRDALVAASYFPEAFDGIVAGSAYANMADLAFLTTGISLASARSTGAKVPATLVALIDPIVKANCDAIDGVKDNLIQNPAACDFRPERDLPRCSGNQPGAACFTNEQIQTVSTLLTAVTDRQGRVVQPGYAVSELQGALLRSPDTPGSPTPWADTGNPGTGAGSVAPLGDAVIRVFTQHSDPSFSTPSVISFAEGGKGPVTGFRVVVPAEEVSRVNAAMKMGIGDDAAEASGLIRLNHKLLIWTNLSDQLLTPYMTINYYKRLAKRYGGYTRLQKNVRLFGLPGTAHCSGGTLGEGPGSFDALSALEGWVEHNHGPDSLLATLYEPTAYGVNFSRPGGRTMPLCKFPTMARYSGKGNVKDGANWSCPAGDTSMLKRGQSGVQAGVIG